MNTNDSKSATVAYKAHLEAVNTLLLDTLNGRGPARPRELAVQLAWTLGAITADEVKARHGVSL